MKSSADASSIWPVAKPLPSHADAERLYFKGKGARFSRGRGVFEVRKDGWIGFQTYMNAFPAAKWLQHTTVQSVTLRVRYTGAADCTIFGHGRTGRLVLKAGTLPPADGIEVFTISIPLVEAGTLIYPEFHALSPFIIHDFDYEVDNPPQRDVALAVCITAFDRPDDLELLCDTLSDPSVFLQAKVIVVNNGTRQLGPKALANAEIVQNRNLGGSGGFARGLLEATSARVYTHVMFIDDDALTHGCAVRRACAFLAYVKSSNTAISGPMFYSADPTLQYELCASLAPYGVRSVNQNWDMTLIKNVVINECGPSAAYGAWWCFIFPLAQVERLPFPFFVRGDDIAFSLQNSFEIVTLNSVAAWQPSFEHKISAPTEYLANRSFLTLPLLDPHRSWHLDKVVDGYRGQFWCEVNGCRYVIAEAMLLALEHSLADASFWRNENNTLAQLDMLKDWEARIGSAASLSPTIPISGETQWSLRKPKKFWQKSRKLLPPVRTPHMWPQPDHAMGREGIVYGSSEGTTLACRFDPRWKASLNRRLDIATARYAHAFEERRAYLATHVEEIQGLTAWRQKFGMDRIAH